MRLVSGLLLSLITATGYASTPEEMYQQNFSGSDTGVYHKEGISFFVVKQPCESEKTYSGSTESKQAEKRFYQLLVQESLTRNLEVPDSLASAEESLSKEILQRIQVNFSAKQKVPHQLLLDRDNGHCVREYVQVVNSSDLNGEKVVVTDKQVNLFKKQLVLEALSSPVKLSRYLNDLGVSEFATAYQTDAADPVSIPAIKSKESPTLQRDSAYDFNFALATALASKGNRRIDARQPNPELAEEFYAKAKHNFNLGKNPDQIIKDLTFSVNAAPEKTRYWTMLSSIYRATSEPEKALYTSLQAIKQKPQDIEMWVYWLKAKTALNKTEADKLHALLLLIGDESNLTPWALKQLKAYK